jgi:uncharacterized Zn finger protein (UPF0148 family)
MEVNFSMVSVCKRCGSICLVKIEENGEVYCEHCYPKDGEFKEVVDAMVEKVREDMEGRAREAEAEWVYEKKGSIL